MCLSWKFTFENGSQLLWRCLLFCSFFLLTLKCCAAQGNEETHAGHISPKKLVAEVFSKVLEVVAFFRTQESMFDMSETIP